VRALVFEHLRPNPIGVYGDVLDARGIRVDRVMLDEGEAIPYWRAYDFLVVMGAAADVWDHDEHPWIAADKETVREAVLAGVPIWDSNPRPSAWQAEHAGPLTARSACKEAAFPRSSPAAVVFEMSPISAGLRTE
jgi:hypothetical protein